MGKIRFLGFSILLLWMVFASGCATEEEIVFDITGNWMFVYHSVGDTGYFTYSFSGSSVAGTSSDITRGHTGTYTVSNTAITINATWDTGGICGIKTEILTGTFTAPDTMSGSINSSYTGACMIWDPWNTWEAYKL